MPAPPTYRHIRAWGRFMHSLPYYVDEQVALAQRERAPLDAIYRAHDGRWVRYEEVASAVTRSVMDRLLAEQP